MTALYVAIGFGAVIAAIWYGLRVLKRKLAAAAGDMSSLLLEGEPAKARVLAAEKRRMSQGEFEYFVTYSFDVRDSADHRKEFRVSATELDRYPVGELIDIVYLPRDPSVSATRAMVDRTRDAQETISSPAP